MDPRDNPYTPNAGAPPPALVGRDAQLAQFEVLLARLERGLSEQSMIVTGLRGVGKTVLLGAFGELAAARGWATIEAEITKSTDFAERIAVLARRALLQVAPKARWGERARRAAGVLRSFTLTVRPDGSLAGMFDVDASEGLADSGNLAEDLTDLFVALGEAARDHRRGVVFLFDEVQFLTRGDLEALISALHKTVQRKLPITLVAAGLPQIPRLAGEARSYSERLFKFPEIGRLDPGAARSALTEPAKAAEVVFADQAVDAIVDYTSGYPYFLQEYGKAVWDEAKGPTITAEDVTAAQRLVEATLDANFFWVRTERTTEAELAYLRAMAELGDGPARASDVAAVMVRSTESVGPIRSRLVEKGLLYTPGYGLAAFTVPQFDRYLIRHRPLT